MEVSFPALAVDTSTPSCSVALILEEGKIFERHSASSNSHSELLFVFFRELLEETGINIDDIKSVLLSAGPGSYTGLRIASSAIKGWFFDTDVHLITVNTMAFIAMHANERQKIHAVLDARRKHFYHQAFERSLNGIESKSELAVREISEVEAMLKHDDIIIGTGVTRMEENAGCGAKKIELVVLEAEKLLDVVRFDPKTALYTSSDIRDFEPDYHTSPV